MCTNNVLSDLYPPCTGLRRPQYGPYMSGCGFHTDHIRTVADPIQALYGPYTDLIRILDGPLSTYTSLILALHGAYTDP